MYYTEDCIIHFRHKYIFLILFIFGTLYENRTAKPEHMDSSVPNLKKV